MGVKSDLSANKGSLNPLKNSSFYSSSKSIRANDLENQMNENQEPISNAIILSTGLKLLISEKAVQQIWAHDRPREAMQNNIIQILKKEGIFNKFEKIEIMVVSEFHLYNLVFCKEELLLNNFQCSVLLTLFWGLLIRNNSIYLFDGIPISQKAITNHSHQVHKQINFSEPSTIKNSNQVVQKAEKSLENDIQYFKESLINHCVNKPPQQLKIIESNHLNKILSYVNEKYVQKFNLYKYVFENKKKNEEIQIFITIDKPSQTLPLSQALYMGYDYQPIQQEDDEEEEPKIKDQYSDSLHPNQDQNENPGLKSSKKLKASSHHSIPQTDQEKSEFNERLIIQNKIHRAKEQFDINIKNTDHYIDERINDPLFKKKAGAKK